MTDDIIVGTIEQIVPQIDTNQVSLVCDSGTYGMSAKWCDRYAPEVGMFLILGYDGFYKCCKKDTLKMHA